MKNKVFSIMILMSMIIISLGSASAFWTPNPGDFIDWPDHTCNVASDCGANTDCVQYMCIGFGSCIKANAPSGTLATGTNECMSYVCDGNGEMTSTPLTGTSCGSAGSYCMVGNCFTPITSCDDGDICTQDFNTGVSCIHSPISGCCTSNAQCSSGNTCNLLNNQCQAPSNCNDNNACTTGDHEVPFMGCQGTPINCNDNNALTTDTCVPATGCVYTPIIQEPFCGDFSCNGQETCSTCITDCGPCQTIPECGDGICNGQETCSSCSADCGICPKATTILGRIYVNPDLTTDVYDVTYSTLVTNANVKVTCEGNEIDTTSGAVNGRYKVTFEAGDCNIGSQIIIEAEKDGLTGKNFATVTGGDLGLDLGLGNIESSDVPLVPEFGAIVGVLTVLGALGMFFFVRKR
jgi:hypothetical protein